jgi:NADH-quinone oxidoreductase subunit F
MGTTASPGHVITTVVGDVVRSGVAEVELGTPLRAVIDEVGGGVHAGRQVKAVLSGIANAVVTAPDQLDVAMSYEGMAAAGSGLGAAGFAVYDDQACMVEVARAYSRFLYVESCNQCPACKLGSGAITTLLEKVEAGRGTELDVDTIGARLKAVTDGNRCYLPVQEQAVVSSLLRSFPEEFADHLEGRPCPRPGRVIVPKLVDLVDGTARYDERQTTKQPDWTYAG